MNWYLNLVTRLWRKVLIRHAKIAQLLEKCTLPLYFCHSIEQSGKSQYLRSLLNVNYMEHGKPYRSHWNEIANLPMVSQWQQRGMVEMVKDIERSECFAVSVKTTYQNAPVPIWKRGLIRQLWPADLFIDTARNVASTMQGVSVRIQIGE